MPLLATDPYGRFLRGPNGFPQIVSPARPRPGRGQPSANGDHGVTGARDAVRTGHAFLDDIAHHAVPSGTTTATRRRRRPLAPDADPGTTDDHDPATYDDEMLGAHFVAGDGRVNENIGLTAVHHVFHSEHNRLRRTTSTS